MLSNHCSNVQPQHAKTSANRVFAKLLCASAFALSTVVATSYGYDYYEMDSEAEAKPSTYKVLTDFLKTQHIRIYGINDSWGSYMSLHFKSGKVVEGWIGNQCTDGYILFSRNTYNALSGISWQQGTQFSYKEAKFYPMPDDLETIYAIMVNDHGIETLRGGSPTDLQYSVDKIGEVVLPGCQNAWTATPQQGSEAVISQFEPLVTDEGVEEVAPVAWVRAFNWLQKAIRIRDGY